VQQSSGVLSEHDRNDLSLYSSDQVGLRDRVPRNSNNRSSEIAPNQSNPSKLSSENQCSRFSSPCVRAKEHENLTVSVTRVKAPEVNLSDQSKNDGGFEMCSM
jgi:myb proto-oncogene protein/myb-related protein